MLFILLFTNEKWLKTFRLCTVVANVLLLTFLILTSIENCERMKNLGKRLLEPGKMTPADKISLAGCIVGSAALAPLSHASYFALKKQKKVGPPSPESIDSSSSDSSSSSEESIHIETPPVPFKRTKEQVQKNPNRFNSPITTLQSWSKELILSIILS